MSSLDRMSLARATPLIEKYYRSIGTKSLLIKSNEDWLNVLTILIPTRRGISDLRNEQSKLLDRIGIIDLENIKILYSAYEIQEFSNIIDSIEKGFLKTGEIKSKLLTDKTNIKNERFRLSSYYSRIGELSEFNSYSIILGHNVVAEHVLLEKGVSPTLIGLSNFNDLAKSWLHVDSLNTGMNVLLIIPLYAKVLSLNYSGGSEIQFDIKIDEKLMPDSIIWVFRKGGENAPIIERISYIASSCESNIQDKYHYISLNHTFRGIKSTDVIEVIAQHKELGLISSKNIHMEFLDKYEKNPFIKSFTFFDASSILEKEFTSPSGNTEFEKAVSWFLELSDFSTIHLGKGEKIREIKVEKGSGDILAYDRENQRLFLIDCTLTPPPDRKIDNIKNSADYISRKMGYPIKPVIFCSANCPKVKEGALKTNVKIYDLEDLKYFLSIYRQGSNYISKIKSIIIEN